MHFFHLHIPINKAIMNIALLNIAYFLGFFSDCQISIETDFLNSGAATPEFSLFPRKQNLLIGKDSIFSSISIQHYTSIKIWIQHLFFGMFSVNICTYGYVNILIF